MPRLWVECEMTEHEAFEAWFKTRWPEFEHPTTSAFELWQAACEWQRQKDEAICAEFSQDSYARYRASKSEYDDGQCDAANALHDKIRSAE